MMLGVATMYFGFKMPEVQHPRAQTAAQENHARIFL